MGLGQNDLMLVQCPSCLTTYRVSDNLITMPNPTFRCSRCKHIFILVLKSEVSPAPETTTSPPSAPRQDEEEDRELSFSFPPLKDREARDERSEGILASSAEEEQPSPLTKESEGRWALAPQDPLDEEPFTIPDENRFPQMDIPAAVEPELEENWQLSSPVPEEREDATFFDPNRDRPGSTIPYLSLFGALLLIYSLVLLMHQVQPKTTETLIKTIPWLGSSVLKNNHLQQGIAFQSLRPSFQTILGNREVFVVSGVAVNRNPISVREVRVEGFIYNAEGKEIESQAISVGNAISSKIIRDLTAQEISILQRLSPQKRFEIPPEESAGFLIVFFKPAGEIKKFSCRVLSAEGGV